MRRAIPLLLVLGGLAALGGCGGSDNASRETSTSTSAAGRGPATAAPREGTTTSAKPAAGEKGTDSGYVVVTSLLGKPLPKEPGCRFAKNFVPAKVSAGSYDGALTLAVTCKQSDGYTPVGQVVNRAGSKPTEIICRDGVRGQVFCVYVPSTSVGLYFTGTDRAVVRRRLEHLIETVAPLPTGITPLSGSSTR